MISLIVVYKLNSLQVLLLLFRLEAREIGVPWTFVPRLLARVVLVLLFAARVLIGALHQLGEHEVGVCLAGPVHVDNLPREHLLLIVIVLLVVE